MSRTLELEARDRVMVVAPHPDDESLATGGLLQRARAVRAQVRLLMLTDGDNNPWAQRAVEHRWRITGADRVRWGARRRAELEAALACLHVRGEGVRFLGYPDQGLCDLLIGSPRRLLSTLATEIEDWRPTLIVGPCPLDRHPDHGAAAVLARFAVAQATRRGRGPAHVRYRVHGSDDRRADLDEEVRLSLTREELERKRRAILCHKTQLAVHRYSLLRFAGPSELFFATWEPRAFDGAHPLRMCVLDRGVLLALIAGIRPIGIGPVCLTVALQLANGDVRCFSGHLSRTSESIRMHDPEINRPIAVGSCTRIRVGMIVRVPLGRDLEPRQAFAQVERPAERALGFFDSAGWRPIAVTPCPDRTKGRETAGFRGRCGRDELALRDAGRFASHLALAEATYARGDEKP